MEVVTIEENQTFDKTINKKSTVGMLWPYFFEITNFISVQNLSFFT